MLDTWTLIFCGINTAMTQLHISPNFFFFRSIHHVWRNQENVSFLLKFNQKLFSKNKKNTGELLQVLVHSGLCGIYGEMNTRGYYSTLGKAGRSGAELNNNHCGRPLVLLPCSGCNVRGQRAGLKRVEKVWRGQGLGWGCEERGRRKVKRESVLFLWAVRALTLTFSINEPLEGLHMGNAKHRKEAGRGESEGEVEEEGSCVHGDRGGDSMRPRHFSCHHCRFNQ